MCILSLGSNSSFSFGWLLPPITSKPSTILVLKERVLLNGTHFSANFTRSSRPPYLSVTNQLVSVLLAGRDTTACVMFWTFRLHVRYLDVLVKLRKEIENVLGDEQSVTRTHVRNMRYLDCVLKETLQVYPPVLANLWFVRKTTRFPRGGDRDGGGLVLIQKGMGITYSPFLMHRQTDLYGADSNLLRSKRWEDRSSLELDGVFCLSTVAHDFVLGLSVPGPVVRPFVQIDADILVSREPCDDGSFLRDSAHCSGFPQHQITAGSHIR